MKEESSSRRFYLTSMYGRHQFREAFGGLLAAMILVPDDIWIVSPWVSDFDVLDNRSGQWRSINSAWGCRFIRFSEVLVSILNSGTEIKLVTNSYPGNFSFIHRINDSLIMKEKFLSLVVEDVHVKGFLANNFFLAGSMNFTYNGANNNDEYLDLTGSKSHLPETRLEFERSYGDTLS